MACYGVWFYLVKTAVPVGLTPCYPIPLQVALTEPRFLASALGILAATAGLVAMRRSWPGVLAAWAVYLVVLAPSTGLIPKGGPCIAADRYCYVPMMGLVVLAAGGLAWVLQSGRFPRAVAGGVLIAGLAAGVALAVLARAQCRTWRDSVALWSHALAVSTEPNPFAYHSLGLVRAGERGGLAEAERLIGEAVRLVPDDPSVLNAMTLVLAKQGRINEAQAYNRLALRVAPQNVHACVNMGNILAIQGHPDAARAAYEQALRLDPRDIDAHVNLGLILLGQGRYDEAESHLSEALRLNPDAARARFALDDLRRHRSRPVAPRNPLRGAGH
jgi:cytochrome c-type biogenesis protein CcmH/NrfG